MRGDCCCSSEDIDDIEDAIFNGLPASDDVADIDEPIFKGLPSVVSFRGLHSNKL